MLFEDVAEILALQVRAGLGCLAASSAGPPATAFRLFDVDGTDIPKQRFTTITDSVTVQIGGTAPVPIGDLAVSEGVVAQLSDVNLLDLVPSTLLQVAGSAVNLGGFVALETGGQSIAILGALGDPGDTRDLPFLREG